MTTAHSGVSSGRIEARSAFIGPTTVVPGAEGSCLSTATVAVAPRPREHPLRYGSPPGDRLPPLEEVPEPRAGLLRYVVSDGRPSLAA